MVTPQREKFATQVDPQILRTVRDLARSEGRQLQALVDEALADLIAKRQQNRPRASVMATYQASHETFGPLYRKLAE
ncbi:hypothetical protein AD940_03170 [Gluconobacter thailandicus]|uniref:hypothetical protein n=1 Tax=Gluconobacter thailandicus TaxID=257438 RepID=UPI000776CE3D|nr:hypothetical protein [Gluconobacter thailandicus]KXV35380.1 hypothetical protein AD940_03170 [Gluconobacter thailandicus]